MSYINDISVNSKPLIQRLYTAPHQSRKKRELTRAVELLKIKDGGEREPHRLLSGPTVVLANVFTSLTADEFTVNGPKVSTILSTLLQRLGSLQRLIAPRR